MEGSYGVGRSVCHKLAPKYVFCFGFGCLIALQCLGFDK
jgi:hypothetical protein